MLKRRLVQTSRGLKFCNPYILRADRCVGSHPTFWLVGASHFMYCHNDCLAIARADLVQTWMRWHKHVLSAASPYFRTMLLSYLEEGSRVSYIRGACGDVANDGRRATVADRGRQQRRGGEPTSRAWSLEQWEVSAQGLFPFRLA